jgi:hypothetical protein
MCVEREADACICIDDADAPKQAPSSRTRVKIVDVCLRRKDAPIQGSYKPGRLAQERYGLECLPRG